MYGLPTSLTSPDFASVDLIIGACLVSYGSFTILLYQIWQALVRLEKRLAYDDEE